MRYDLNELKQAMLRKQFVLKIVISSFSQIENLNLISITLILETNLALLVSNAHLLI